MNPEVARSAMKPEKAHLGEPLPVIVPDSGSGVQNNTKQVSLQEYETSSQHAREGSGKQTQSVIIVPSLPEQNKVLVGLCAKPWGAGRHQCPAGKVDPREGLREAACRELLEETGWDAKPDDLFFVKTHNYVTVHSIVRQIAALPTNGKDTARELLKDSSGDLADGCT